LNVDFIISLYLPKADLLWAPDKDQFCYELIFLFESVPERLSAKINGPPSMSKPVNQ